MKQDALKQPMDQNLNDRENLKIQMNGNKNIITFQNLWNVAKTVLRGKFITKNTYIEK